MNWKQTTLAILIVIPAYGFICNLLPNNSFWITDGGNKFIQLQNFERNLRINIEYPSADIDPKLEFFPYAGHHFHNIDGKIYSFYPFYFPLISILNYKLFGYFGLYLIPLLSTLLCMLAMQLIKEIKLDDKYGVGILALAFSTPMFFYGQTFWEHVPSVLLSTVSVYLIMRIIFNNSKSTLLLITIGILLGLSAILREEGYTLTLAIFISLLFVTRQKKKLLLPLIGWLVIILPFWLFQFMLYGHPLGFHFVVYSAMKSGEWSFIQFVSSKISNYFFYIFCFHESAQVNILLIPYIAATIFGLFVSNSTSNKTRLKLAILISSALTASILTVLLLYHDNPVINTRNTQSLIGSTPFLLLAIVNFGIMLRSQDFQIKFLTCCSLIFMIINCLVLNQKDVGIIWGPRHFLHLYPLLVPLAIYSFRNIQHSFPTAKGKYAITTVAIILLIISLVIQATLSIYFILKRKFPVIL